MPNGSAAPNGGPCLRKALLNADRTESLVEGRTSSRRNPIEIQHLDRAFKASKLTLAERSSVDEIRHDCLGTEANSNFVVDIVTIGQIMRTAQDAG